MTKCASSFQMNKLLKDIFSSLPLHILIIVIVVHHFVFLPSLPFTFSLISDRQTASFCSAFPLSSTEYRREMECAPGRRM